MTAPKGHWDIFDNVRDAASTCNSREEFRKLPNGAYGGAIRNDWIESVCAHMTYINLPNGYWTKDRIFNEAMKYSSRTEFFKHSSGAYRAAIRHGYIDEACDHMVKVVHAPRGYWTKLRVLEISRSFSSKSQFAKQSSVAYNAALANGWLDEATHHMVSSRRPNNYWNIDTMRDEAYKYSSKVAFIRGNESAYRIALRKGWLDKVTYNMESLSTSDDDVIYIWKDKSSTNIYKIGITSNRLGDRRIIRCATSAGLDYAIVAMVRTKCSATIVESIILKKFTTIPDMGNVDGKTEFRILTSGELSSVLDIINEYVYI